MPDAVPAEISTQRARENTARMFRSYERAWGGEMMASIAAGALAGMVEVLTERLGSERAYALLQEATDLAAGPLLTPQPKSETRF